MIEWGHPEFGHFGLFESYWRYNFVHKGENWRLQVNREGRFYGEWEYKVYLTRPVKDGPPRLAEAHVTFTHKNPARARRAARRWAEEKLLSPLELLAAAAGRTDD